MREAINTDGRIGGLHQPDWRLPSSKGEASTGTISPASAGSLAWAFYPTLRKTYCSMSGDLPKGRTEIDYYNRHLIDLAGDRPCPLNRRVYEVVRRMEERRVPPGPAALDELAA